MKDDHLIYTGQLTYKGVEFTFVFGEKELKLIPPKEKRTEIETDWLMTQIEKGVYIPKIPIMEEKYLLGTCNESNQKIIFFVRKGSYMGGCNAVLTIEVTAYIICKSNRSAIDRICFTNPEIDAIHPVNKSFVFSLGTDLENFNQSGVVSLTTNDFESTTTETQTFIVDNKAVTSYFCISRGISTKLGEPPISLNSSLMFEFEPTTEYEFILWLWHIAKDFLSYLCYRRDVYLPTVKLSAPYADGKHEEFATLYVVDENGCPSVEDIKKGRYIKQGLIAGHEGQILTDIASGELYLRHIPESYRSGRRKDAAKFVMITAAFEWEFHRNYPEGITKSEATQKAENEAENKLQELIDNDGCCKKLKKIYKFLKKLVRSDSLQSEIKQIEKDYSEIIDLFGNHLYSLNKEQLIYSEMGKRLSDQRNHFAHGDLDQDFIDLSLLDLIFMEYIVYALQLKHYGIEVSKIQNAINDLFHCGFALPQA